MASASTEKLETLLQCAICLEKLNNPRAFECFHFFCEPCIGGMKPKTEDRVIGYACPSCRRFTPKDKLRRIHFMHELLEVTELAKREQQICGMCKEANAEFRCIDCKEIYCANCQINHNRVPAVKNHKWEPLGDTAPMLDKHVYCAEHPDEIAKIHCKECNILICLICNGTEHKQHTAETIAQALKRASSQVTAQLGQVKRMVAQNKDDITNAKSHARDLENEYEDTERQIDVKYQDILKKADKFRKQAKDQLIEKKKKQIGQLNGWIDAKEMKMKSHENIVALSETSLSTAQHSSLLQVLQSGLGQSLESCLNDNQDKNTYNQKMEVRFEASPAIEHNFIGSIVDKADPSRYQETANTPLMASRTKDTVAMKTRSVPVAQGVAMRVMVSQSIKPLFVAQPLSVIARCHFNKIKTFEFVTYCPRFTKLDDELWCIIGNTAIDVQVLDLDFNTKRKIQLTGIGYHRSVTQIGPGLVVAASQGLYRSNMDGTNTALIARGDMADMCWEGNLGYILNDSAGKVCVVEYDERSDNFVQCTEITLARYRQSYRNTIQVTQTSIFITDFANDSVLKYNISGERVSSYSSRGGGHNQLLRPLLCGADSQGALLIADHANHRLKMLAADGTWHVLEIRGLFAPYCAVIHDKVLYVAHYNTMSKYIMT